MVKRVIGGQPKRNVTAVRPPVNPTALKSVVLDTPKAPAPKPAKRVKADAAQVEKAAPKSRVGGTYLDHGLTTSYDGPSGVTTRSKSRTPINMDLFGTLIGAALTARDEAALRSLHTQYGAGQFQRGNLDAGIIRRLGERGMLLHVKGSDIDPATTFKLTRDAVKHVSA